MFSRMPAMAAVGQALLRILQWPKEFSPPKRHADVWVCLKMDVSIRYTDIYIYIYGNYTGTGQTHIHGALIQINWIPIPHSKPLTQLQPAATKAFRAAKCSAIWGWQAQFQWNMVRVCLKVAYTKKKWHDVFGKMIINMHKPYHSFFGVSHFQTEPYTVHHWFTLSPILMVKPLLSPDVWWLKHMLKPF